MRPETASSVESLTSADASCGGIDARPLRIRAKSAGE